jgi:hypothetical protein
MDPGFPRLFNVSVNGPEDGAGEGTLGKQQKEKRSLLTENLQRKGKRYLSLCFSLSLSCSLSLSLSLSLLLSLSHTHALGLFVVVKTHKPCPGKQANNSHDSTGSLALSNIYPQ